MSEDSRCLSPGVVELLTVRELGRIVCVSRAWRSEAESPLYWTVLDCRAVLAAYENAEDGVAAIRRLLESPRFSLLESVNLECCKPVSDAELALLHPMAESLVDINLNALHSVSAEAVAALAQKCVRCESFSLYWHPRLSDSVLHACATSMGATLRVLNLAGCGAVTDAGICKLAAACTRLERLNITRCCKLSDDSLRYIANAAGRTLIDLIAYADAEFTDVGYGYLANSGIPRLEKLDTCGARLLTSAAIAAVVRRCGQTLIHLNCSWCVALDDRAGLAVAMSCRVLKLLSFHGIVGITELTIGALAESTVAVTLTTLDINGCVNIVFRRQTNRLSALFPFVTTWIHHR